MVDLNEGAVIGKADIPNMKVRHGDYAGRDIFQNIPKTDFVTAGADGVDISLGRYAKARVLPVNSSGARQGNLPPDVYTFQELEEYKERVSANVSARELGSRAGEHSGWKRTGDKYILGNGDVYLKGEGILARDGKELFSKGAIEAEISDGVYGVWGMGCFGKNPISGHVYKEQFLLNLSSLDAMKKQKQIILEGLQKKIDLTEGDVKYWDKYLSVLTTALGENAHEEKAPLKAALLRKHGRGGNGIF